MSQENINDNVKAVQDVVETIAKTEQGKKYVYGSNDSTKSFDCSSFVQFVNEKIGITLPRTAREQAKIGQTIETNFDEKKLQKGDRLYFKNDPKQPEIVTHTAIYLGNGKIIHASSRSGKVVVEKIADRSDLFNNNFACAQRDINNQTASKTINKTLTPILRKLKITPFNPYSSKENKINSNNKNFSKKIIKKNTSVKNTSVLALKFLNPFNLYHLKENKVNLNNKNLNNKNLPKEIIKKSTSVKNTSVLALKFFNPFNLYHLKENKINLNNVNKNKSKTNKNNFTQSKKITIESTNLNKNFNSKNITSSIKTNSNNKKTNFNSKNITSTIKTKSDNKKSITKKEYETQKYKINI